MQWSICLWNYSWATIVHFLFILCILLVNSVCCFFCHRQRLFLFRPCRGEAFDFTYTSCVCSCPRCGQIQPHISHLPNAVCDLLKRHWHGENQGSAESQIRAPICGGLPWHAQKNKLLCSDDFLSRYQMGLPSKHGAFTQCCVNVRSASTTVDQHWHSIGYLIYHTLNFIFTFMLHISNKLYWIRNIITQKNNTD